MKFKKIGLEDRNIIYKYIQSDYHQNCIFTFGNNMFWNQNASLEYTVFEDVLLYRAIGRNEIRYCTPDFKKKWKMIMNAVRQDAQRLGMLYRISSLQKRDLKIILENTSEPYWLEYHRGKSDYIYSVEKLAELKGRKYEKKRNLINYFRRTYNWNYKRLTADMFKICKKYEEQWLREKLSLPGVRKDNSYTQSLYLEKTAIDYALRHFEQLNLVGGVLLCNEKCVAFTIGEKLNNSTFVQHFEKADYSVKGAYQMILQMFIQKELLGRYEYVNREEDMGVPTIRKTKLSYYPTCIYDKFILHWRGV